MTDYEELTDNELVKLAQSGDDAALETILLRYKPLVHKKSQPYYLAGGDDDDIIQEGLIGLYKAVMDFDSEKFPLFHVFAGVCIERRMISAVKKASRLKHSPLNSYVSLSGTEDESGDIGAVTDSGEGDPEKIVIERESARQLQERLCELLSPFEREVLLSCLSGRSYKETAAAAGRDPKAVDNAMQRVKKKLDAAIENGAADI